MIRCAQGLASERLVVPDRLKPSERLRRGGGHGAFVSGAPRREILVRVGALELRDAARSSGRAATIQAAARWHP